MPNFLKTNKTKISFQNRSVTLKGVNFGGWLMMEAYILHAPNSAERLFKKNFANVLGKQALEEFEKAFRANFISEDDFKNVKTLGFNCIRIPFNCRLVETSPYKYDKHGLSYLDQVISWAKKNKIWIILDLHAAPGAQNHDWHSDSMGKAELWTSQSNQKRVFALWEF